MKEPIIEVMGTVRGFISQIMSEINFGVIWDKKNKQDVYFSTVTNFTNITYEKLNEGDLVEVLVVRTARGLFAKNLSLKIARPTQEKEIASQML